MIITKIRLQEQFPMAAGSTSWPLPSCDFNLDLSAGQNGYLLKNSTGLEPPALNQIVQGFDANGVPIYGGMPEKRQIVLRVELTPYTNKSPSTLRDELYKFNGRSIKLGLMYGSITIAEARGYISRVEATHFTNKPEVQLTIECDEAEFIAPKAVNIPLASLNTLTPKINYEDGTAETGMTLVFNVTASQSAFTISNHSKLWHPGTADVSNSFTVTYPFLNGDVVTIKTSPKEKIVTVLRSAVTTDLAGYINAGAVWPMLVSGVNAMNWTFASSWMTWVSASYIPKYWGV